MYYECKGITIFFNIQIIMSKNAIFIQKNQRRTWKILNERMKWQQFSIFLPCFCLLFGCFLVTLQFTEINTQNNELTRLESDAWGGV